MHQGTELTCASNQLDASGAALPVGASHSPPPAGDDNMEIVDMDDSTGDRHTVDDVDTLDDPRYAAQMGVGPNAFGRRRPTSPL